MDNIPQLVDLLVFAQPSCQLVPQVLRVAHLVQRMMVMLALFLIFHLFESHFVALGSNHASQPFFLLALRYFGTEYSVAIHFVIFTAFSASFSGKLLFVFLRTARFD